MSICKMYVQCLFLILCVALVKSTLEKKIHVKCLSETKISAREVREADYTRVNELSEAILYYIKCVEMNEKFLDDEGTVMPDMYKEKLDKETEKVLACLRKLPQIYDTREIRMLLKCL
ncbi:hypothetical protein WA026_015225 [Henosepilachna vigintioctopunctata]|uniref:Uncharacterized protein n=1 Tax=Henosepilachna vigintioctopunctata TaxID=420089 RepID=A0AAW1TW94_9CUCU